MKILQIADLHITESIDFILLENKLKKMYEVLEDELNELEDLLILICGDIIDKGDNEDECIDTKYSNAQHVLNFICQLFENYRFKIEFVPGNHDLQAETFQKFNEFISKYTEDNYLFDSHHTGVIRQFDDFNLVLLNSIFHCDTTYGKIDFNFIDELDDYKPCIIMLHHTFLSENDLDISAVRNAYKFFEVLEKKCVVAIFHGHTHGYKDIIIGDNKCNVIGVGPFLKPVENINNQFNLVELSNGKVERISNYRFSADLDRFTSEIVFYQEVPVFFKGSSAKGIYEKVVEETKKRKSIYNLQLNIEASYIEFEKEIFEGFSESISTARDWQSKEVPESLYYNHGIYMKTGNIWWVDYICDELLSKATSSRAIIPLIDFSTVIESKDDFLPSFDIVQFGFADEAKKKIIVTVYLRALEVNNFLKINICEIYLMIKELKVKIRSIDKVDICICAFRAQYKEMYGCFRKAQIDHLKESSITLMLVDKKFDEVAEMLNEKLELNETVVQDRGLKSLLNAISSLVDDGRCSKELLITNKLVLEKLELLKIERAKNSNYSQIEELEKELADSILVFSKELENEGGKE